jgi:hypothetical protein
MKSGTLKGGVSPEAGGHFLFAADVSLKSPESRKKQ